MSSASTVRLKIACFDFHYNSCCYFNESQCLFLLSRWQIPRRMLRLSFPQKGSILWTSSPSAVGLWSGDEGMGGTWSWGVLELLGGGEIDEEGREGGGGEEAVGVGVWGVGVRGVWADVGLLAADWDMLLLTLKLDRGLVRSRPPTLAVTGEWRESLRDRTGEEGRDGIDRGGGEENLRQKRGDLLFVWSLPLLFRFVAKKSSKDLKTDRNKRLNGIKKQQRVYVK